MSAQSSKRTTRARSVPSARERSRIGLVALLGGLAGMFCLFFVPIPAGNREALLLALGLVLGWGGCVINYEFGSSPAGRNAALAGTRPLADKPSEGE
jgi:uncharacterized membrane protein YccC